MVCPRGGGIFSLYLGFRKKTGAMYMGHYHIFFYSKANAPYFPGVGGWGFQLIGALCKQVGTHVNDLLQLLSSSGLKKMLIKLIIT